jgi:hypothetical protein
MQQSNPLSQFFRQPVIYIRLPSGGKFYPTGALNMPPNQELPVLPMTAVDEITYRTPDALFNGTAIVSVIQSCIPGIRNAWAMPSTDIDAVLVAIRIASFGHGMDMNSTCPSCDHTEEIKVDLRIINDRIQPGDYDQSLTIGNLDFYFRPMSYHEINQNNQIQFEQQQALRIMDDNTIEEPVKMEQLKKSMKIVNDLTVSTVAQSISAIKSTDAMVTEQNFILEYLNNCNSQTFNQLRDHVIALKQSSEVKPLDLDCPECHHTYKQQFTLDLSSFFENAS